MTDASGWLGPATDLLREKSLDDAAQVLESHAAMAARLELAVRILEDLVRYEVSIRRVATAADAGGTGMADPILRLITEHRGETRYDAFVRLCPRISRGDGLIYM